VWFRGCNLHQADMLPSSTGGVINIKALNQPAHTSHISTVTAVINEAISLSCDSTDVGCVCSLVESLHVAWGIMLHSECCIHHGRQLHICCCNTLAGC